MARRRRLSASSLPEAAGAIPSALPPELRWPFARLEALTQDELRESVYEIFFCACRSAPGGGTRPSAAARGSRGGAATPTRPPPEVSSPTSGGAKNMAVTSRLKRALGLRARNTRPTVGAGGRPLTSAEIMRRQMGVSEQTDARLRKTLVRSLVGPQMSRKVDSLVLPLELLRHLKPADFFDAGEHRAWQLRQLRVLEAGLVSHPSVPLDRGNASASALRDTVRSAELQTRPVLDARALSAVVAALCRRSVDACRWADGYPLNVHLYLTLLRAVFDARDETVVLDEVDELMELIRKTWNVLGLNDTIHNVCFTWLFLEKYVTTGETEPDLLSAALAMLEQVRDDARRQAEAGTLEAAHLRVLSATLASMHSWAEEKLLDYHESFGDDQGAGGSIGAMENAVSLAVLAAAMLSQDVPSSFAVAVAAAGGDLSSARSPSSFSAREREIVERYIKSSVRRAFTRVRIYVALDYIYIRIQHISCWRMHAAYICNKQACVAAAWMAAARNRHRREDGQHDRGGGRGPLRDPDVCGVADQGAGKAGKRGVRPRCPAVAPVPDGRGRRHPPRLLRRALEAVRVQNGGVRPEQRDCARPARGL
jgi:hypothetical protein